MRRHRLSNFFEDYEQGRGGLSRLMVDEELLVPVGEGELSFKTTSEIETDREKQQILLDKSISLSPITVIINEWNLNEAIGYIYKFKKNYY